MSGKVIFYQLGQKFLDRKEDMPAEAKQVVYYSLAIGHHIGVIDCLKPILECPADDYAAWLAKLPEGAARSKLEGLLKWGEINIDNTVTHLLAKALDGARAGYSETENQWATRLIQSLADIEAEPAIYLIAKHRDA